MRMRAAAVIMTGSVVRRRAQARGAWAAREGGAAAVWRDGWGVGALRRRGGRRAALWRCRCARRQVPLLAGRGRANTVHPHGGGCGRGRPRPQERWRDSGDGDPANSAAARDDSRDRYPTAFHAPGSAARSATARKPEAYPTSPRSVAGAWGGAPALRTVVLLGGGNRQPGPPCQFWDEGRGTGDATAGWLRAEANGAQAQADSTDAGEAARAPRMRLRDLGAENRAEGLIGRCGGGGGWRRGLFCGRAGCAA